MNDQGAPRDKREQWNPLDLLDVDDVEFLIQTLKGVMDADERTLYRLESKPTRRAAAAVKEARLRQRVSDVDRVRTILMNAAGRYIKGHVFPRRRLDEIETS